MEGERVWNAGLPPSLPLTWSAIPALLTELRQQVLEPLIAEHHGRVVKLMGDGFLVDFSSVVDAVTCSLAWQEQVEQHEAEGEEDKRLKFRIGINLGDVIVEGDDIHGDGVNIASRLEALAETNGICLSDDAYRQARGKIEIDFEDIGEQNLRNVAEPVRVYRVIRDGDDTVRGLPTKKSLPLPDKPSIAVLPFTNMSGDPEQEYFSDGITEDIITELSRFSSLFVIARNSSFAYKGQSVDVRRVAQELGVRYVLEGSIRRAGNRVRITAQLIDSETGNQVWAERYDRDLEDIFALQDEITRNVVGSIAPQIELAELERSRKLSDTNLSAYELALKAQALTYDAVRLADPRLLVQAMSLSNAALELDNRSTHALWTRGMGCVFQHIYGWGDDPGGALTAAIETADHLIGIDPSNAKSYVVRAWAHQYRREYDLALADYRRALELNPNLALNLITMSWSEAVAGLAAEAREHAQMALKLSPRDTDIWLGWAYATLELASFIESDFAEAVKWGRLAIQMHARMPFRQIVMVAGYGYLGDLEAAKSHVDALKAFAPDFLPAVLSGNIEVFKLSEHNALLVEGLRRAGL
jgi:TolB-like protein